LSDSAHGYQQRLQDLVNGIRQVDLRHIVLVPEWNSHEDSDANQSIRWDQGMVKIDDDSVGYVLHFYEPLDFTALVARVTT
jgi:hypothetical protein